MKEELKSELDDIQRTFFFTVYKTTNGKYINQYICENYNVGNKDDQKNIKGNICCKVEDDDIKFIETISKEADTRLIANYITIFDLQLVLSFTVYIDKNHDNKLYIIDTLCNKYGIKPQSKRMINKTTYTNVTEKDINTIEVQSKSEQLLMKRKYVEIYLEDEPVPEEKLFTYYYNADSNEIYISRDILELGRNLNIEIECIPKIIENINCYLISKETLNKIEKLSNSRGVEKIISLNKTNKSFSQETISEENKISDDINNISETYSPYQTVIVYKDLNTNKLYIPVEHTNNINTNKKIILNKECCETTTQELEKIYNTKFIIVDVYPKEEKIYNIIVCKHNGLLFVSKQNLNDLKINIVNSKKILVNHELYIEITNDDLDIIRKKETNKIKINIIYKQISPIKK